MDFRWQILSVKNAGLAWGFHVSPASCKHPEYYSEYIRFNAIGDQKKGLGVTHLLVEEASDRIAGYITLRATSLISEDEDGHKIVQPSLEVAELAVDVDFERKGVGSLLIGFAIDKADELRRSVLGIRHIVVCADPDAIGFYKKMGLDELSNVYEVLHDGWNDRCKPMYITLPEG